MQIIHSGIAAGAAMSAAVAGTPATTLGVAKANNFPAERPRPLKEAGGDMHWWTARILAALQKTVESVLEVGQLLIEAKIALPTGGFLKMIDHELPFKRRLAQLYMEVARNPRFADTQNFAHLPPSLTMLSEIGKLPVDVYGRLVADGTINPNMRLRDVAVLNADEKTREHHNRIHSEALKHDLSSRPFIFGIADPPWEGDISRGKDPYPRLTIEQICNFKVDDGRPVRAVFAENAILYMWIIDGHLLDVRDIFREWGFDFRRMMVWPKISIRVGQIARAQHELICVGTRGQFKPAETRLRHSTLIVGETLEPGVFRCAPPHDQRHSSKPPRLHEMIEAAYPQHFGAEAADDPVALELFSRVPRSGWAGQGFEYPGQQMEAAE
jgi:N6-adenosine-specific RNA methylase IME4